MLSRLWPGETYNTLSTPPPAQLIYPVLIDGYVRVNGPGNDPPGFDPPLVSPRQVQTGETLQFTVRATDADGDSIALSAFNVPTNASFPAANDQGEVSSQFTFTPATNQAGQTYNVVFVADDGFVDVRDTVVITVLGEGGNQPPTVSAPSSREVAEGAHIEFAVTATDPENDFINLTATNLPANAYFSGASGTGTVIDTFYFDPDYNQGGNTYTVTFTATDAANNSTSRQVDITVLDAVNDFLEVAPLQGALPGSLGRDLVINLRNPTPIYAIQFDLLFDPEILEIRGVEPDSLRAYDYLVFQNLIEDGRYRVGILPMSLDTIVAGTGPIINFQVDVDAQAVTGASMVTFDSATTVHDTAGTSVDMIFDDGSWVVDILGDANLDGIVSIGDCIAVLSNMLGRLSMNIRASDAGDYNRDGDVRISDLQGIVFSIFGLTVGAPPLSGSVGTVEIDRDYITPGYRGNLPVNLNLETEAAGVQFTIDYDPEQVVVNDVMPGDMVNDLNLDYTDTGSRITGVIFAFDLAEFGPVSGELVRLDVDFIGDNVNPSTAIRLSDFEIVTVDAYKLNVGVVGELPDKYTLYQNYPNPFNARTIISFEIPYSSMTRITLYNVLGQMVKNLHEGYMDAGTHQLSWDGTDTNGENVTSGVYFYRLEAENFDKTKKMLLVK
jgi:hypothetical protein